MSAPEPRAMRQYSRTLRNYVIFLLMTSLPHESMCCFPMDDVFAYSTLWLQPLSLSSRIYISVGVEADDIMTVRTDGLATNKEMMYRCERAFGGNRFLVRIEEDYDDTRYTCLQLTSLTPHVVRQGKTNSHISRKKIDCLEDIYVEDENVLIAYHDVAPQPCPLSGGYQLIMHEGMAVAGHCMDSVLTYNPRIQFQCDLKNSGRVLVDFGRACEPAALTNSQKMGGRHMTNLHCVGSWQENGYKTVLLNMRDQPYTFWCLHYKHVNHERVGTVTSEQEEFLSTFLTLDARCSGQAFSNEDVPRDTSMFGFLATYRPVNDLKCTEKAYLQSCSMDEAKCFESTECPNKCNRCKKIQTSLNCTFTPNMLGSWKTFNSRQKLAMTVESKTFKSSSFGEYMCRSPPEAGLSEHTYPVVQQGTVSTCMPSYACAQLYSLAPGVLAFKLRQSVRDQETGEPLTCRETQDKVGHILPVGPEKMVTLLNLDKLKMTGCNHMFSATYPTLLQGCKMAVKECSGNCQNLDVDFDIDSCGNETFTQIEKVHTCYATINFEDGVRGIIAKSDSIGRYLCWLFGSTRLFIASPELCNQEGVLKIFSGGESHITYDPINAISLPLQGGSIANTNRPSIILVIFILSLFTFLKKLRQH